MGTQRYWDRRSKLFLDAATRVLRSAGTPITLREVIQAIETLGLFHTDSKTPTKSLYSLIWRENRRRANAGLPALFRAEKLGLETRWYVTTKD